MKPVITAAISALMLSSCLGGEESIYHDIPPQGWSYAHTLTFDLKPGDGELLVGIRHDTTYPYSNLWLEISDNAGSRPDTVEITLCDNFGRWLGNGFGGSYQLETPVKKNCHVDSATIFKVRHIMRIDTIHGIDQLGLHLNP